MKPTSILYRAGLLGIVLSSCTVVVFGNQNLDSPTILRSGKEFLDGEGNYELSWSISNEVITFEVRAKTSGYVALGFSPNSIGMAGADIFIGGVYDNGGNYSSDRHATGYSTPVEDQVSNYELMLALETDNQTVIKFERFLNTNDEEDYPITDATINVLWAMGETDAIQKHQDRRRGIKSLNFFKECSGADCGGKDVLHVTNIFTLLTVSILSILAKRMY